MKNCLLLIVFAGFIINLKAQGNLTPEEFDKLWNKASNGQPVSTEIKQTDDNLSFEEKWKKLDSLQKVNPKAAAEYSKTIKNTPVINTKQNLPVIPENKPTLPPVTTKTEKTPVQQIPVKTDIKKETETLKTKIETKTTAEKEIVKEKVKTDVSKPPMDTKIQTTTKSSTPVVKPEKPKLKIDTSKNYKEFQFETTPVLNGNATYDLPNPEFKDKNDKSGVTTASSINKNIKETKSPEAESNYKEFAKEADIIRKENDRKLDSILKAVNVSIAKPLDMNEYIDIYMEGGELMKNGNSKIYDRISILNSGKIHRELATQNIGEQKVEKTITRSQVVKIAQFINDMGFFEYKDAYDCAENDKNCLNRLKSNPIPVPLKLSVTIGNKKHTAIIYYYSPSKDKNWVNYPESLDKIVNAVYALVER